MMMSILQLSAILLATFCLSGNALPVEKSSSQVTTGWSGKPHNEKSKLIGSGLKSQVDKIHKTDTGTIIKPEESKNDEIPIYIQTPDASDLGVPVDHIPVQESIVKSLIADHTDIEKIEFTDLGKSEKNLIPSNDHNDKPMATDSKRSDVDKVQIKLGTSFEAIKSEISSVSPIITTQSSESLKSETELPKSDLDTLASDKISSSSSPPVPASSTSSSAPTSSPNSFSSSSLSSDQMSQEKEKIVTPNETNEQPSQSLFYLTSITTFAPLLGPKIDKIPVITGKGPALDSIKSQASQTVDLNQSKSPSQTVPPPPISITSVPLYSSNDDKNTDDQKLTTIVDYKVTSSPSKLSGNKLTYSSVDTEVLNSSGTGKGDQIKNDDGGDKIGIKQNSPPASSPSSPSKSSVTSVHPVHNHQKTSPSSSLSSQPISSSPASSSQSPSSSTPSSIRYQLYESSSSKDISDLISDPVDQATKLLIDLEEQVELYLKSEKHEELVTTNVPLSYGINSDSAEHIEKQGATQIQSMIDEVNRVAQNVETVISELVSNRRYMTAAMFRSLLNYLRRVRISLERLQTRMQVLGVPGAGTGPISSTPGDVIAGVSPPSTITATYLDQIRDRIFRITEEIRTLISRMRLTLSPSSSPSPLMM